MFTVRVLVVTTALLQAARCTTHQPEPVCVKQPMGPVNQDDTAPGVTWLEQCPMEEKDTRLDEKWLKQIVLKLKNQEYGSDWLNFVEDRNYSNMRFLISWAALDDAKKDAVGGKDECTQYVNESVGLRERITDFHSALDQINQKLAQAIESLSQTGTNECFDTADILRDIQQAVENAMKSN